MMAIDSQVDNVVAVQRSSRQIGAAPGRPRDIDFLTEIPWVRHLPRSRLTPSPTGWAFAWTRGPLGTAVKRINESLDLSVAEIIGTMALRGRRSLCRDEALPCPHSSLFVKSGQCD